MGHHHHGHDHHHGHGHMHHLEASEGNRKGLIIALSITASIMFLEFFGGIFTNSLALLSDSGHMFSDAASLLMSLIAITFAARAATATKSYGFHRFEILAALFNGITLFVVAGFIIMEAVKRFQTPPTVASGTMIIIACVGLLANLLSAWFLMRKGDVKNNLNLRSAYLHVIGDALGSVGAIIAGIIMIIFKWYYADPLISVIVALIILKGAWGVLKHSIHILMEGVPPHVQAYDIRSALASIDGVMDIHDMHIWTITSGLDALSCHIRVRDDADPQQVLQAAIVLIEQQFHIEHTTFQIETSQIRHAELLI